MQRKQKAQQLSNRLQAKRTKTKNGRKIRRAKARPNLRTSLEEWEAKACQDKVCLITMYSSKSPVSS